MLADATRGSESGLLRAPTRVPSPGSSRADALEAGPGAPASRKAVRSAERYPRRRIRPRAAASTCSSGSAWVARAVSGSVGSGFARVANSASRQHLHPFRKLPARRRHAAPGERPACAARSRIEPATSALHESARRHVIVDSNTPDWQAGSRVAAAARRLHGARFVKRGTRSHAERASKKWAAGRQAPRGCPHPIPRYVTEPTTYPATRTGASGRADRSSTKRYVKVLDPR